MPVHDWTNVSSGIFHHFHQSWTIEITKSLNGGVLPSGFSAMAEQWAGGKIPDVLTLSHSTPRRPKNADRDGGVLTLDPPASKVIRSITPTGVLARRANHIVIRHRLGRVVAVIELISPGNKESRREVRTFVEKTIGFLEKGVHVLMGDLFPPTLRDPDGLHNANWDEMANGDRDEFPSDKPLSLVSYQVMVEAKVARIEHIGIGDSLPNMPIYLTANEYVMVPLESTYLETWKTCPEIMRDAVETGIMPSDGEDE